MKKLSFLILFSLLLTSCGQEVAPTSVPPVKTETPATVSETLEIPTSEKTGTLTKSGITKSNSWHIQQEIWGITETWTAIKIWKDQVNYQIIREENGQGLHLMKNWEDIKIASTDWDIKNVIFLNGLMICDYISTAWSIKRVYDIKLMKELGSIWFWEFTKDKKYIYSCMEAGYWPGNIQSFNLVTLKDINLSKKLLLDEDSTIVKKCSFDEDSHNISFTIDKGNNQKSLTKLTNYIYNLDEDSLLEVKLNTSSAITFSDAQIQDILAKIDANTKVQQEIAKNATGVLVQGDFRAEYNQSKIKTVVDWKINEFNSLNWTFLNFIDFSPSGNYVYYKSNDWSENWSAIYYNITDSKTWKNILLLGWYESSIWLLLWTTNRKQFIYSEKSLSHSSIFMTIKWNFPKTSEINIWDYFASSWYVDDDYLYTQWTQFNTDIKKNITYLKIYSLSTLKEVFSKELQ